MEVVSGRCGNVLVLYLLEFPRERLAKKTCVASQGKAFLADYFIWSGSRGLAWGMSEATER